MIEYPNWPVRKVIVEKVRVIFEVHTFVVVAINVLIRAWRLMIVKLCNSYFFINILNSTQLRCYFIKQPLPNIRQERTIKLKKQSGVNFFKQPLCVMGKTDVNGVHGAKDVLLFHQLFCNSNWPIHTLLTPN